MIIQARFGSAQTSLGYQFYDAAGTLLGTRVTTGITALPETGSYIADATVPSGAAGVYWDSTTSEATEDLRDIIANVRTELATELARIDVATSTRSSHSAADVWAVGTRSLTTFGTLVADIWASATRTLTAASDSAGITTLLTRIASALTITGGKVTVGTNDDKTGYALAVSPPTAAAVADAVWDEALSGHTTAGTTGAQLTAAGAAGDPWATIVPAAYADGTAGAAIGRLNNTPPEAPVVVIPNPADDASLTVVYVYTESITNVARAGIVLSFKLTTTPAKSERLLEKAPKTMETDADGYAQITLQRNLEYRVTSNELGLSKVFTPTGETFDLLTLVD